MKTYSPVTVALLWITALVVGCATSASVKQDLYHPQFTSSVKAPENPESSGITIALVNPSYAAALDAEADMSRGREMTYPRLFQESLSKDLEKLLIGKGFRLIGPFADYSEMTFPQKKQSDLLLQVIMNFVIKQPTPQTRQKTDWAGLLIPGGKAERTEFVWEGSCTMSGFISFEVWEPLSGQKLWAKKVDIPPLQEDCSATGINAYTTTYLNASAKLLEQVYSTTMTKADIYFSREEMELVKKQGLELREKKVY